MIMVNSGLKGLKIKLEDARNQPNAGLMLALGLWQRQTIIQSRLRPFLIFLFVLRKKNSKRLNEH